MSDEGFLRRWSRLKAEAPSAAAPAAPPASAEPPPAAAGVPPRARQAAHAPSAPAVPTLDDVARLEPDSDFSAFMAQGVDKDVRRLAMKKLFSDPHFNAIDRLDVYMDDYNKPSPVSAAMLAALHHTKNLFAPLASDNAEEAAADQRAGAEAGEGATVGPAMTDRDESGTPTTVASAADGAPSDGQHEALQPAGAAAAAPLEPMQFHGAAAGGVLQQTQQGNA